MRQWKLNPVTPSVKGESNAFADFTSRYMRDGGSRNSEGVASIHEACAWIRENTAGSNPIPFLFTPQVALSVRLPAMLQSGMRVALASGVGGTAIVRQRI